MHIKCQLDIIKKTKEGFRKRFAKGIKIFLKKKKKRQCARKRYRNLSDEEKNKKHQYDRERYKNLSEDKKQRLVGYRENNSRMPESKDLCLLVTVPGHCMEFRYFYLKTNDKTFLEIYVFR